MSRSRRVRVCNPRGLHARAAARFVSAAADFDAKVCVARDGESVNADSIMELLMLAAGPGAEITITADGPDADAAVDMLSALVECGFEELD